jgi:thiol-disulfide isomerase/thioredoxin
MKPFTIRQAMLFLAVALVALAAGYLLGEYRHDARTRGGAESLIDVSLPDSEGMVRDINEWRGKPLLLNFWATWCAPCREEIPELVEAQEAFADHGLQVLGIAVDKPAAVRRFMTELSFNYPSLVAEAEGMDLMARYGNQGALPFTLAFDRNGSLVGKKLGRISRSEIRTFAEAMLD